MIENLNSSLTKVCLSLLTNWSLLRAPSTNGNLRLTAGNYGSLDSSFMGQKLEGLLIAKEHKKTLLKCERELEVAHFSEI